MTPGTFKIMLPNNIFIYRLIGLVGRVFANGHACTVYEMGS